MVNDLRALLGSDQNVANGIGCAVLSINHLREGKPCNSATARALWATWARFLHPELMQTAFDWMTYGRFYKAPTECAPDQNWCDWSI